MSRDVCEVRTVPVFERLFRLSLRVPGHVIVCLNRIARASLRTEGDGHSELQIGDLTLTIHRISHGIGRNHTNREYCRRVTLLRIVASAFIIFTGLTGSTLGQPKGLPSAGTPEVKPATPDPLVAAISRWDANHDGVFTCEEWSQYANRLFTIADKNADGVLDDKEFQQIGNIEPVFAGADMAYFDDNNDDRIGRSEFADKPSPFFARYDANRDCRVTAEEIKGSARPTSGKGTAPRGKSGSGGGGSRSGF
jgi:EF hand